MVVICKCGAAKMAAVIVDGKQHTVANALWWRWFS